jgi:hypothetical protein
MSTQQTTQLSPSTLSQSAGAARRKNGHKVGCKCHICENIRTKEKRGEYGRKKMISKKANGHKENCQCPICRNMANMKRTGKKYTQKRGSKKRRGTRRRRSH